MVIPYHRPWTKEEGAPAAARSCQARRSVRCSVLTLGFLIERGELTLLSHDRPKKKFDTKKTLLREKNYMVVWYHYHMAWYVTVPYLLPYHPFQSSATIQPTESTQ